MVGVWQITTIPLFAVLQGDNIIINSSTGRQLSSIPASIFFGLEPKEIVEVIDKQNSNVMFNNVALGNGEETPCIISYNIPVEVISSTITLDSYVKENKISKIDFIKIDADGVQNEIIEGSKYILDNMNPIVMIEMNMNVGVREKFSGDEYVRRVKSSGHLDRSPEGVMAIPKSSEFTVTPDDNKLIEDMQSHGYYVDCVFNGQNVFFTKNGGN